MNIKALIAGLLLLLVQPVWAADSAPELLIKQTANDVLASMKSSKDEYQAQPAKLYAMVDEKILRHFDFDRMTNLALGRYKRKVKDSQKKQLVDAFRKMLVRTYAKALLEYNDEVLIFLPMRGSLDKGEVTIRTEIEQKGGFPIPINYAMYENEGNWQVYDLSIDNISLVTNYRSSFARVIKDKGVDHLIKTLQERNREES